MTDEFNLEEEYGGFLDALETHISEITDDDAVEHFGVKGMKWGVRKDRSSNREPLKSLGPDSVTRKTASGEEITLSKNPPTKLHRLFGKLSKSYREAYANSAELTIKDGAGKKVGEAEVAKKNKDELYLSWLGIKKSARGKGYATAVMKAGAEFGRQEGFKRMVLEVPGNAPDARHIYENLGFKVTKTPSKDEIEDDLIWGGLTEMVYNFNEAGHAEMSYLDKPDINELIHFGVKGMKWGVHRRTEAHSTETANKKPVGQFTSGGGKVAVLGKTSRQINREVSKAKADAQEFARAKMFYGETAGTRRKQIKAIVESRSKGNPEYQKAFQDHLNAQDMSKHTTKARRERKRKDVKNSTAKTARGISHYLRGNPQYASAAAAMIAGGAMAAHKAGVDKVVLKAGKSSLKAASSYLKGNNIKPGMAASEFLKNL